MDPNDLAEFLRAMRQRLQPQDVGLPKGVTRRTPGLRRAEVVRLAHISVEYYTRLEQARSANPSRRVLGELARTLRLSPDERAHLFNLAGVAAELPTGPRSEVIASLAERSAETGHRIVTISYFGDLDVEGLEIAQRASDRGTSIGLPPLEPAVQLYAALLQRPDRETEPADPLRIHAAARWLPEELAPTVVTMLLNNRCLRQEALPLPMIRKILSSDSSIQAL